jgi:hypothetical protein
MNQINYLIFYHNFYNIYFLLLILYLAFYKYKVYDLQTRVYLFQNVRKFQSDCGINRNILANLQISE